MSDRPKWRKREAGFYTYGDTGWAVAASYDEVSRDDDERFVGRVEWAAVANAKPDDHNAGDNVRWFDTMREARAFVEREIRAREERP